MGYSLSVDLGTTFVAAALAVNDRVEMFTLGNRSAMTPSAVYLQEDGTLATGEAAANLRTVSSPDRVAQEFKRRIGDPTPVVLGGQAYSATALMGALLRDVVTKIVQSEGNPPDNVVLTHPANWGTFRRSLFSEVVKFGGLSRATTTVTEPEAAATRYATTRQLADGQTVAVYDLGGGTFDATVLRKVPDGLEILGTPEGIERLGGMDFDESILRYVNYVSHNALTGLDMRDGPTIAALARLRQDCTLAKETLSSDTETVLPVFLPGRQFDVPLTRSIFEDLIRAQVESTVGALARTLDSAQVRPDELDAVLLIGGSSRIPLVGEMVSAELGRPIALDTHPKHTVALGAATIASRAPRSGTASMFANGHESPLYQVPPSAATAALPAAAITARMTQQAQQPSAPHAAHGPHVGPEPGAEPYHEPERADGQDPPTWRYESPPDQSEQWWLPRPELAHGSTELPGHAQQRWLLVTIVVSLLIAGAVTAWIIFKSRPVNPQPPRPPTPAAQMVLTTSQVKIGNSYFAIASGFVPGETIRITWIGPTTGTMGDAPADVNGIRRQGPIIEQDPPGNYLIISTGLNSGRTAQAPLEVLPADQGN
ncbi:MAG: Hsp70 family protein [Pseudonocardia sp.]|nr:Hsp70 family protein [Pseudonocardia sp.]